MSVASAVDVEQAVDRRGLAAGVACYLLWGVLPLLFQAAVRVGAGPVQIVAWRTVIAAPVAAVLVWALGQGGGFRALRGRDWRALALSAALIAVNWSVYVWAVTAHRTLEGSLGYYINPLLNMAAGRLLFGERMDRAGWAAVALATAGVVVQTLALGSPPWVSLALAVSFCGYGVVRKRADVPPQAGLLAECVILTAPALAALAWTAATAPQAAPDPRLVLLLLLCGPATVVPLALFATAARRLPLTTLGFLQFIAPTMVFFIGVRDGEPLSALRLLSFALIWAGVAVFAAASLLKSRRALAAA